MVNLSELSERKSKKYYEKLNKTLRSALSIIGDNMFPYPIKNENRKEYIKRFMQSEEARRDYPDLDQRLAVEKRCQRRVKRI